MGVSGVKTTIDGMRSTRDTQLQEMAALKNKLREQNQRLLTLSQEKARIEARNKINAAQDAAGQEAIKMAFDNKQITLKQMKDKIGDLQQQVCARRSSIAQIISVMSILSSNIFFYRSILKCVILRIIILSLKTLRHK